MMIQPSRMALMGYKEPIRVQQCHVTGWRLSPNCEWRYISPKKNGFSGFSWAKCKRPRRLEAFSEKGGHQKPQLTVWPCDLDFAISRKTDILTPHNSLAGSTVSGGDGNFCDVDPPKKQSPPLEDEWQKTSHIWDDSALLSNDTYIIIDYII